MHAGLQIDDQAHRSCETLKEVTIRSDRDNSPPYVLSDGLLPPASRTHLLLLVLLSGHLQSYDGDFTQPIKPCIGPTGTPIALE